MKITLRAARVNMGLKQEQAAKLIGVTRGTIGNWEKGISFPDALSVQKIESVYGVAYDDLIFLPSKTLKA